MSQELLYTSAPQGLKLGSRGFCTVLRTSGMSAPLVTALESLSGYRPLFPPHDERAALNPIIYSHLLLSAAGRTFHVLSRISAYGLDYSQRPNKLAHHLVLDRDEQLPGGPANLLLTPGTMRVDWDGQPQEIPARKIVHESSPPSGVCQAWQAVTGDAGWAGVLAETFLTQPNRLVILLFEPGQQILPLFAEAISLLPPEKRWEVTFSTYFTGLPPATTCLWRAMLHDSKEARDALRFPEAFRLDLTSPFQMAQGGPLVVAARTGVRREHDPTETLISQESELPSTLRSEDFAAKPREMTPTSSPPAIAPQPPHLETPVIPPTPPSRPPAVPADLFPTEPRPADFHWFRYVGLVMAIAILIALGLLITSTHQRPLGEAIDTPAAKPAELVAAADGPSKADNAPHHQPVEHKVDPAQTPKPPQLPGNDAPQDIPVSAAKPAHPPQSTPDESQSAPADVAPSAVGNFPAENPNGSATAPDHASTPAPAPAPPAERSRSEAPEIRYVQLPFVENERPDHNSSGRSIKIHTYEWPKPHRVPSAEKIHEFFINREQKERDFRKEFGGLPQFCELLTPRWIPWKAERPKKNEFNPIKTPRPSILYVRSGPDGGHHVATIEVTVNKSEINYYISRESQINYPLLSWCAIHVINPDDKNSPRQIILNRPFIPDEVKTAFSTMQETVRSPAWTTNYYLRETDQPLLTLERLTLKFEGEIYHLVSDQPQRFSGETCSLPLTGLANWLHKELKLDELANKLNLQPPNPTGHSESSPPVIPEMQIDWEWIKCHDVDDLGRLQLSCEIKKLIDDEGIFSEYDRQLNALRTELEKLVKSHNLLQTLQRNNNYNNDINFILNTIMKLDDNYEKISDRFEKTINNIVMLFDKAKLGNNNPHDLLFLQGLPDRIKILYNAYQHLKDLQASLKEHIDISEIVITYDVYKMSDVKHQHPVRLPLLKYKKGR